MPGRLGINDFKCAFRDSSTAAGRSVQESNSRTAVNRVENASNLAMAGSAWIVVDYLSNRRFIKATA